MNDIVGQERWTLKIGSGFGETHHHLLYRKWVIDGVPPALLTLPMKGVSTGDIYLPILRDITEIGEALKIAATVSHLPPITPQALEWTPVQTGIRLRKGNAKTFPNRTRGGGGKRGERGR